MVEKTVPLGVARRAARRSEMKVMYAVRVRLVRSSLGWAGIDFCIEDPRVAAHELSRLAQRTV